VEWKRDPQIHSSAVQQHRMPASYAWLLSVNKTVCGKHQDVDGIQTNTSIAVSQLPARTTIITVWCIRSIAGQLARLM